MLKPLAKIDGKLERVIANQLSGNAHLEWLTELRTNSGRLHGAESFPASMVSRCAGVESAILNDSVATLQFYVWLASGCLTTAFILSQRNAALRRIGSCENEPIRSPLLDSIQSEGLFVTVGFSHLTTSGLHLSIPSLTATRISNGWILNGTSPWVTGARHAEWLVIGAVEANMALIAAAKSRPNELLCAIPGKGKGVRIESTCSLMALDASSTGPVTFEDVFVDDFKVLHGPIANVMEASHHSSVSLSTTGTVPGAGGLQTSALAIGHSAQAIEYLINASAERAELVAAAEGLESHWRVLYRELFEMNAGEVACDASALRKKANDLVLNSTQAALVAAKGAGFSNGHDVGRWCREAMFFLVWSCPHSVAQAHLCSFVN